MAEIVMCSALICPIYDECYRAQAKVDNEYQRWRNFEYTCNELSGFEDFIPINDRK